MSQIKHQWQAQKTPPDDSAYVRSSPATGSLSYTHFVKNQAFWRRRAEMIEVRERKSGLLLNGNQKKYRLRQLKELVI